MIKKKHYKYKNLTILFLSFIFAGFLYQFEEFHNFLLSVGEYGYIGAFLAGLLFVSSFTFATAVVVLLVLAEKLNPYEIAMLAGAGGVLGDFLIFRFVKDGLAEEITPLFQKFGGKHVRALLHTKYFSWSLPLIGALIIVSPLPDELGVSLLGVSKMSTARFLFLSFILNFIGAFLVISASSVLKP